MNKLYNHVVLDVKTNLKKLEKNKKDKKDGKEIKKTKDSTRPQDFIRQHLEKNDFNFGVFFLAIPLIFYLVSEQIRSTQTDQDKIDQERIQYLYKSSYFYICILIMYLTQPNTSQNYIRYLMLFILYLPVSFIQCEKDVVMIMQLSILNLVSCLIFRKFIQSVMQKDLMAFFYLIMYTCAQLNFYFEIHTNERTHKDNLHLLYNFGSTITGAVLLEFVL